MRAIVFHEHSPTTNVYQLAESTSIPVIGPNDVLVRVQYAALNRLDDWVRVGWKGLKLSFPHVPCSDFCGVIAAVGDKVVGWNVGQRVTANPLLWCGRCQACVRGEHNRCQSRNILGEDVGGTCAEYVKVPAVNLISIPDNFEMARAAAASLVYVTAWHSLMNAGNLRAGERVLVVGAGGGVNTAAIQIAKLAGCEVFVIASNADKARQVKALGADWVHDRSIDPNWSRAVYVSTNRAGVDMVVDNVGKETWTESLRALRSGGRLVTVGGTTGYDAAVPVNLMFGRHLSIIGSTMGTQGDYTQVMQLIFANKLNPVIDSIYPMNEFRSAIDRMRDNQHFGKILIEVGH